MAETKLRLRDPPVRAHLIDILTVHLQYPEPPLKDRAPEPAQLINRCQMKLLIVPQCYGTAKAIDCALRALRVVTLSTDQTVSLRVSRAQSGPAITPD